MIKYIFIIAFIAACFFQGIRFAELGITDDSMWANQAQYVQIGDPREFDFNSAYGHPGGPIIEGIILIHNIFKAPYDKAVIIFLTLFDSLIIAGICVLCYLLKKDHFWWIAVLGMLSNNIMYEYSTPPSALASLLAVFLCLLTLYFYENKIQIKSPAFIFWSFIAGLLISTRIDIGAVVFFVFIILLKQILSWKKIFFLSAGAFLFFIIFDPFMWFMPIQHIGGLIYKITYHYADFTPIHITPLLFIQVFHIAGVSIFLSLFFLFWRKKNLSPLPYSFIYALLFMTFGLCAVFLTAHYQAPRYFMPLVFIWETFLPLFIFSLIPHINFDFLKTAELRNNGQKFFKIFITAVLIIYPTLSLIECLWINYWINFEFRILT